MARRAKEMAALAAKFAPKKRNLSWAPQDVVLHVDGVPVDTMRPISILRPRRLTRQERAKMRAFVRWTARKHRRSRRDLETHRLLVERLVRDYPDGWALSCKSDASELAELIQWAEAGGGKVRLGAWVKPFASFKPNVNPGYCWEPVLFKGGRKRGRGKPTLRDFVSCNVTLQRGLPGAKPDDFSRWVFEFLGMEPGDELADLFPGTGAVGRLWAEASSPPCYSAACPVGRHAGPCATLEVGRQ